MKRSRRTKNANGPRFVVIQDRDPKSGAMFRELVEIDHALMLVPQDWPADVLTLHIQATLQSLEHTLQRANPDPGSVERLLFDVVGLKLQLKRFPHKHQWALREGTAHREAIDSIDLVYRKMRRGIAGMTVPRWIVKGTALTGLIMLLQCQSFDVCTYLRTAGPQQKEMLCCPNLEGLLPALEAELKHEERERSQRERFWKRRRVSPTNARLRSNSGRKSGDSRRKKAAVRQQQARQAIENCCRNLIEKGEMPSRKAILIRVGRELRVNPATLRRWFNPAELNRICGLCEDDNHGS